MSTIGIFEAKAKLSELVRQVRAGESFTITQRGEPAALLTPLRPPQWTPDLLPRMATK
jgi:prevent-host-death family protein